MLRRFVAALATTLSVCGLSAQIPVPHAPAPETILAQFHLRAGSVQSLTLPLQSGAAFQVDVVLGGVQRTLFLTPKDIRADDFQLLVHDAQGIRRLPTPVSVTYSGSVSGLGSAEVAAALFDGQLRATVHAGADVWGIEPLQARDRSMPADAHIVYRERDLLPRNVSCGLSTPGGVQATEPEHGPAALRIAELAIDADVRFYALNNNDPIRVQNQVCAVINGCNLIYRRDVEIEFSITTILVRTTNVYAWNGDLCNLLGQFRTRWNANHASIRRDLAHLFTGEGTFSGVIGCANLGVVCTTSGYGASKAYSDQVTNVGLVAHEIGHNWNAGHCDSQAVCNIMCSGLGGCSRNITSFDPTSITTIVAHRNSRTCLSNPVAATVTGMTPNTVTSWQPAPIELTGTNLGSVTSVTVGGAAANFVLTTPTTLRVTPPSPMNIGQQPVVVTNSVGSSAPLQLTVTGNHPSVLTLGSILLRNFPLPLAMHSDAGWVGLPVFSFSDQPSVAPGLISLGVGNGFTDLTQMPFLVAGPNGAAQYGVSLPPEAPVGAFLYWQLITFNPANPVLPLEVSNMVRTEIR